MPDTSPDEVGRLWNWGMHEDQVFNERLSFFALAESILFTSAIVIYAQHHERFIESVIAACGLVLSAAWYLLLKKQSVLVAHIRERLKSGDKTVHGAISDEVSKRLGWRNRAAGKDMIAKVIPGMFALLWLAFIAGGIA